MNLYKITIGSYSDASEEWYSHERAMNQPEFGQLLISTWLEVTKPRLEALEVEKVSECQRVFGVESANEKPAPDVAGAIGVLRGTGVLR